MKNFFFAHLHRALKHELISGSVYIFIGSMVLNVSAFIFNLLFARNLTTSDYGTYTSLIALFTIATIPGQPLVTTMVAFASGFFAENDTGSEASLYRKSLLVLSIVAVGFIGIFVAVMPFLREFLHIMQPIFLLLISCMIGSFYLSIIQNAFLQARLQFLFVSFFMALGGVVKIFFGILFILLGFQIYGAIGASIFSIIIPFLFGFYPLRNLMRIHKKDSYIDFKKIFLYALPTSCTIICLTLLISTDVLLVKHFFSATQAGLYAGISLIGKTIFYFTGSIPMVMFPLLIKRYKKGENVHRLLFLSFLLVIVPALLVTTFFFLYPHIVISIFLGKTIYQNIAEYLGLYGMFITVFSLVNVLTLFFLSIKKTGVVYILIVGSVTQLLLLSFLHTSFFQIISISLILTLFIMAILLLYYVHIYVKDNKKKKFLSLNNNSRI